MRIVKGKGGRQREVPVFPGQEEQVLALVEGRRPEERVFAHLPSNADIHTYRRQYAQDLYMHLSGLPLPPSEGRLHPSELNRKVALQASRCLGHNRYNVLYMHYLR